MKNQFNRSNMQRERDYLAQGEVSPMARSARVRCARPRVLLALFEQWQSLASARWAGKLAVALDADLYVVRVISTHALNRVAQRCNAEDAFRLAQERLHVQRATRTWLTAALGHHLPGPRFTIRSGRFVDEVATHAISLGAELIVVPSRDRMGSVMTSLASLAGIPVLVARKPRPSDEAIIAATDLEDERYPVLRKAADLGERLDASVVALHNVNPISIVMGLDMTWPTTILCGKATVEVRRTRIERVIQRLHRKTSAVVLSEVNPVDAILSKARERAAKLIIVGARPRRWFDRLLHSSAAAQVVNRSRRSVLVLPLEQVGARGKAPLARA